MKKTLAQWVQTVSIRLAPTAGYSDDAPYQGVEGDTRVRSNLVQSTVLPQVEDPAIADDHLAARRRQARLLCFRVFDKGMGDLLSDEPLELDASSQRWLDEAIVALQAGQPLAYVLGTVGFWNLDLQVTRATLIPRPDTETLVATVLERLPQDQALNILELATGSGAIALSLAHSRAQWRITASDLSSAALEVAKNNAQRLGLQSVEFIQSDWFASIAQRPFDAIVANPPYLSADDLHLETDSLQYEPRAALVADQQGLGDLDQIIATSPIFLKHGGWLMVEHGATQADAVAKLLQRDGFCQRFMVRDLAGRARVSGGQWLQGDMAH